MYKIWFNRFNRPKELKNVTLYVFTGRMVFPMTGFRVSSKYYNTKGVLVNVEVVGWDEPE